MLGVGWLSELVSTLWFEDVGFLHEQMLDTPLGRFSIRQMIIFLIFGLLAWTVSLLFADIVLKIVVVGVIFFSGAAIFNRKIKTLPPEKHLLYLVNKRFLQINQKPPNPTTTPMPGAPATKAMLLSATLGVPLKVVGILKDLATGKALSSKNIKVSIDNTAHTKSSTDEDGLFCTYFIPDRFGLFQIAIQPEGFSEPIQQITVSVNPKTEAAQTAETKTNP